MKSDRRITLLPPIILDFSGGRTTVVIRSYVNDVWTWPSLVVFETSDSSVNIRSGWFLFEFRSKTNGVRDSSSPLAPDESRNRHRVTCKQNANPPHVSDSARFVPSKIWNLSYYSDGLDRGFTALLAFADKIVPSSWFRSTINIFFAKSFARPSNWERRMMPCTFDGILSPFHPESYHGILSKPDQTLDTLLDRRFHQSAAEIWHPTQSEGGRATFLGP